MRNLRTLEDVDIRPFPAANWLYGENGAGKTSILEAIVLLARGHSFRSPQLNPVLGPAGDRLQVIARLKADSGREIVLGVERHREGWTGRIDGRPVSRISEFARCLPLVVIEPESHQLVSGGPRVRRQLMDWTLFHVEHTYLDQWKAYARLLRQRNAALRTGAADSVIEALDVPLIRAAGVLDDKRRQLVVRLAETIDRLRETITVRLEPLALSYRGGWPAEQTLAESLARHRATDRERGFTRYGPHRADLQMRIRERLVNERLSRGQQKLVSLLLLLGQHALLARDAGRSPLLLLDDPVSELDAAHLHSLLDWVSELPGQVWITAVSAPGTSWSGLELFHVEQGRVEARPVV